MILGQLANSHLFGIVRVIKFRIEFSVVSESQVFGDLLGMSEDEVDGLASDGVI